MGTVINPPRAGDLLNMLDASKFVLSVGSYGDVDFSTSQFKMGQLSVGYDGKELTFLEHTSISSPSLTNGASVTLQMNLGSGLKTYFTGKLQRFTHSGSNNREAIEYTAVGTQKLANDVIAAGGAGVPQLFWGMGQTFINTVEGTVFTTITTYTGVETITTVNTSTGYHLVYGTFVKDVIDDLFSLCLTSLASYGIPATIGTPGTDVFSCVLSSDISLENMGFYDALQEIVNHEPHRKAFFDDVQQAWVFPSLISAEESTLSVNSVNITNCDFDTDISNRFTAIELKAMLTRARTLPYKGIGLCEPDWESSYETDWSLADGAGVEDVSEYGKGWFWVYRRWRIPGLTEERNPYMQPCFYAQYDFGGKTRFIPIQASIDFKNHVAVTNCPVYVKGNPYHKGHAISPTAVWVTWWRIDAAPTNGWVTINYPALGTTITTITSDGPLTESYYTYEGSAYDIYGIRRVKTELVDPMAFFEENAKAKLALMKDVVVSGTLELEGDPIEDVINLQRRVRVSHSSKTTGIQSYAAMLTGYSYTFGTRGRNSLSLSTDVSGLMRIV